MQWLTSMADMQCVAGVVVARCSGNLASCPRQLVINQPYSRHRSSCLHLNSRFLEINRGLGETFASIHGWRRRSAFNDNDARLRKPISGNTSTYFARPMQCTHIALSAFTVARHYGRARPKYLRSLVSLRALPASVHVDLFCLAALLLLRSTLHLATDWGD